jgi:gliding motility-associated-like protein
MFGDTTICFGDSALFTATATGGWGAHFFYWPSTGDTTSFTWLTPRHSEEVIVQVQDDCHTFTVPAVGNVKVIRPIANFEIESHTLYENLPITFHNTTYGGSTYQWEFGDGQRSTLVNPNNTYDVPGTYYITLHAQNEIGCRDSVTKPITILPEFYIYIPNAITPNGDGINDVFAASTINVVDFEIYIFNRWGQQMFHSTDKRFQWDATYQGEVVEDGVYVYKVHYTSINGDDEKVVGHVVSLR